jgi:Response regulator containing CheY-like receiver, AAA-type ATPase, and DNA-binding domains
LFPGNVRELRNLVERALILSSGNRLTADDFPLSSGDSSHSIHNNLNLDSMEQQMIASALEKTTFNQTEAAALLGISRDALKRKIAKFNIAIHKSID